MFALFYLLSFFIKGVLAKGGRHVCFSLYISYSNLNDIYIYIYLLTYLKLLENGNKSNCS